ncbi:MAG: DNA cytosine methyltransferase [ANME-2 cluster archaeon]|nr:DNA cytosine methyltransferase [ANME-2 cluster archaeon]
MTSYPTGIDLFCGCGGFSLGMIQAGFHVVAAIDNSPMALATYYANLCDENTWIIGDIPRKYAKHFTRPDAWRTKQPPGSIPPPVSALFCKSVFEISGWDMLNAAGIDQVDVVIGSPPCQSFSSCNTSKKKNDPRHFLMFEYARLAMEIYPRTMMLENVPDVTKATLPNGWNLVETFQKILSQYDWELYYEVRAMYPDIETICSSLPANQQCNLKDFNPSHAANPPGN